VKWPEREAHLYLVPMLRMAELYSHSYHMPYRSGACLTFKRQTFESVVTRAGRSLFKCPLLLCQFLSVHLH
jgi:hypothetical protein